ncbi:MAG: bifunctional demethylmenaquinone methyltransferase/2-methoxy-6-polyprenyl-1,4-benzoquinol methylase UbiE [Chlamydiales bacterium]
MYHKSKPESIQAMFASIAKNYDYANTIFSFGCHKMWNRKLIQSVTQANILLDLCSGTGEIGLGFLAKSQNSQAILLDFCPEMLEIAKEKGSAFQKRYRLIEGDAQDIPLETDSVDAVTIAYGIRNVQNPTQCFKEVIRVLKPEGCFAILELTRPSSPFLRFAHKIYLKFFLPFLGKCIAKNIYAYRYLSKSIENFASCNELEGQLRDTGFRKVKIIPLMGGLATLFISTLHKKNPRHISKK